MFALLLLFASVDILYGAAVDSTRALPHNTNTSLIHARDASTAASCDQRTTYGIVWSCLVTILACVWGAVHPNIPGPFDGRWTIFKRRTTTMFGALIAPELMVVWALRQHLAAKEIRDKYNQELVLQVGQDTHQSTWWGIVCSWLVSAKKATYEFFADLPQDTAVRRIPRRIKGNEAHNDRVLWTMTHGFFVQMGGFMLYEDEIPKKVLEFGELRRLIRTRQIAAPTVTEAELQDRSKGNALSKCVIVLQTLWFVVQSLARFAGGLPLSELEVVTLAFAVMNGIVYWVWWDKPQGAYTAIPIHLHWPHMHASDFAHAMTDHGAENPAPSVFNARETSETVPTICQDESGMDMQMNENIELLSEKMDDTGAQEIPAPHTARFEQSFQMNVIESQPLVYGKDYCSASSILTQSTLSIKFWSTLKLLVYPLVQLGSMTGDVEIPDGALNVPAFYTYGDADVNFVFVTALPIGALFGAVHFFACTSVFPSSTEQTVWHISTLITTAGPTIILFLMFMEDLDDRLRIQGNRCEIIVAVIILLMAVPMIVAVVGYIPARIALLAGGIFSLRALPQDVFIQIKWTSFIPHL